MTPGQRPAENLPHCDATSAGCALTFARTRYIVPNYHHFEYLCWQYDKHDRISHAVCASCSAVRAAGWSTGTLWQLFLGFPSGRWYCAPCAGGRPKNKRPGRVSRLAACEGLQCNVIVGQTNLHAPFGDAMLRTAAPTCSTCRFTALVGRAQNTANDTNTQVWATSWQNHRMRRAMVALAGLPAL